MRQAKKRIVHLDYWQVKFNYDSGAGAWGVLAANERDAIRKARVIAKTYGWGVKDLEGVCSLKRFEVDGKSP